jgi:FKBP-type peptidyl-prolyl cis-trans isomerase SlyD
MKIGANSVVAIDYTLTNDAGDVLDTSEGAEPLTYMHGAGQIIPGLEAALEGRQAGDSFKAVVAPKDGYGERTSDSALRVSRDALPEDAEPEEGMEFEAVGPDGNAVHLWVIGVEDDSVLLSPDHPLAGETLHFDVKVRAVRAATQEELEHGHAHGPGAEHHH